MSESQLMRLSTSLKNRVKELIRHDPRLLLSVNRAITAGLEDFLARERLEAYEAVDVEQLVESLRKHANDLQALSNEMSSIAASYGKMAYSKEVLKTVTVRTSGRIVLSEFIEGTVFRKRYLLKANGDIGGVELVAIQ